MAFHRLHCISRLASAGLMVTALGCTAQSDGRDLDDQTFSADGKGDDLEDDGDAVVPNADQTLHGTEDGETLEGHEGSDRIFGAGGDDQLLGGPQGDMMLGGAGDDRLLGEHGPDLLNGGAGDDTLLGGEGDDYYVHEAGDGSDVIEDAAGSRDRLTIAGIPPEDVTELHDGDDLVLILPEGTVRIVDHFGAGAIELVDYEYGQDSFTELEHGIHWFGAGNQRQKYVPTVENPLFDPSRPTVLIAHGWQPSSVLARRRPGLNYGADAQGPDIDLADAWVEAGWNVGMFYWQNFADEDVLEYAEAKIWSPEGFGGEGMRWRRQDGSYSEGPANFSVGDLAHGSLVAALLEANSPIVRIAGHSLGNQVATHTAALLRADVENDEVSARLLPERLSLLDPFWSRGAKAYLEEQGTGGRTYDLVRGLLDAGVAVDAYRSSPVTLGGDTNAALFGDVCLVELQPNYFDFGQIAEKHMAGLWHYVLGFGYAETEDDRGDQVASAGAPVSVLWDCIDEGAHWRQSEGTATKTPEDDGYTRID